MKKAFLVKATVMTRVIIDVDDDFNTRDCDTTINGTLTDVEWDKAIEIAIPLLQNNVCEDNIDDIVEDIECPFSELDDDFRHNWKTENLSIAQLFYSNNCPIISRADYESSPISMCAMEFDDDKMANLAHNIYNVLHCQYGYTEKELYDYFNNLTNIDIEYYKDLDIAYWEEMKNCAITMGMKNKEK